MRIRSLLGERRGVRELGIEARIGFSERMYDRIAPIFANDLDRRDAARSVLVNKFLGRRLLQAFSESNGDKKGEASRS